MPFDNSTFTEYVSDPRYDLLKKPVKIDKDNRSYELQFVPPATAKSTYTRIETGAVDMSASCWNDGQTAHYADVYMGSDYKANMMGSYVLIKYQCAQARVTNGAAFKGTPIAPTAYDGTGVGTSMPWNPVYMFNTMSLMLNNSQTPVEQYVQPGTIAHISTARMLQKYKKTALEENDATMLTPCLEAKLDNTTISAESATRSQKWMGSAGLVGDASGTQDANGVANTVIREYQKAIPFSDLFECCSTPGIWSNTNKFRFQWTLKQPHEIAFRCGAQANASITYVYITDVRLLIDSCRMTPTQAIDTAVEKQQGTVENLAHYENFAVQATYQPGNQMVVTSQRDVQQVILGFPSLGYNNGVNPIQYHNAQLTSLALTYGNDMPLRSPLSLGGTNQKLYMSSYIMYKKACGADLADAVPLAMDFYYNYPQYNLYYVPIYNPLLPHRQSDPKDVRIDTFSSLGAGNYNAVMVIRKFTGAQVFSDGTVELIR